VGGVAALTPSPSYPPICLLRFVISGLRPWDPGQAEPTVLTVAASAAAEGSGVAPGHRRCLHTQPLPSRRSRLPRRRRRGGAAAHQCCHPPAERSTHRPARSSLLGRQCETGRRPYRRATRPALGVSGRAGRGDGRGRRRRRIVEAPAGEASRGAPAKLPRAAAADGGCGQMCKDRRLSVGGGGGEVVRRRGVGGVFPMRMWHAPATVCDGAALVHRDLGRRRRRATDGCSVLVPRGHGNEDGRGGSGGALRGDEVDCHSGTRRGKRHPQNIDRSLLLQAHGESLPAMIDQAAVLRTSALPRRGEAPSSREHVLGADQRVVGADQRNGIGASMNAEHAHANVLGWLARYQQTCVSEVPGCSQLVALKIYQNPWSPSIPQTFTIIPIEDIKQQRTAIIFLCPLPYFLSERNAWFFNFSRRQSPSGFFI
jgi:hypothetical protein